MIGFYFGVTFSFLTLCGIDFFTQKNFYSTWFGLKFFRKQKQNKVSASKLVMFFSSERRQKFGVVQFRRTWAVFAKRSNSVFFSPSSSSHPFDFRRRRSTGQLRLAGANTTKWTDRKALRFSSFL
jgi:hypothetical protein